MISSPIRFEQPCGQKEGECETEARKVGETISHLIRMCHLFPTGVIKPTKILILFQKIAKMNLFD